MAVWVGLCLGVSAGLLGHLRWGLLAYLAAVLVAPTVSFFGSSLRLEHALAPLLVLLVVNSGRRRVRDLRLPAGAVLLVGWLLVGLAVSLASTASARSGLTVVGVYSLARPFLVFFAAYNMDCSERDLRRMCWIFVFSVFPIGLLAVGQFIGNAGAAAVTLAAYSSISRGAIAAISEAAVHGYALRAVGVFENVSYAATYFLLVIGTALELALRPGGTSARSRRWAAAAALAGLVGGVATLSVTFFAGFLFVLVWTTFRYGVRRTALVVASVATMTLLVAWGIAREWAPVGAPLAATVQIERTVSGSALASRYGAGSGVLGSAIDDVKKRPVLGWGLGVSGDVPFYSDSLYVFLFYTTGAVGATVFLVAMLQLVGSASRLSSSGAVVALWAGLMLVAGIGAATVFIPRLMDWWWVLLATGARESEMVPNTRSSSAAGLGLAQA